MRKTTRVNDLPLLSKADLRERIARDTAAFLRAGGKVRRIMDGASGDDPLDSVFNVTRSRRRPGYGRKKRAD